MIFHLAGYSRFQEKGMIESGQISKLIKISFGFQKKSLDQKINPKKIQQPQNKLGFTLIVELREAGIRRYYHESSDCFEYPKNHY